MCGITGIYNIDSKYKIDKEILIRMTEAIRHRGPDESSYHIEEKLGFGFRRLSIIDLNNGHQPFFTDDLSVSLICNGEIYNYKELRNDLIKKGYIFKTNCDIEVILPLYLEYGTSFLNKLNGQFSFAIYDNRKDVLFVARDHFGICPLFYTLVDGVFIFGSEIKSILKHPIVRREVNLTGLDQVFTFPGLLSPSTMFKNINSLKPGHFILVKDKTIFNHQYWDLEYPTSGYDYQLKPESYYIEKIEELIIQSIKLRLNADVPLGFYLSGGLDSSLIGALIKKIRPNDSYQSFSIGFSDITDKEIDERKYQRIMADHIQSIHNEINFDWSCIHKGLSDAVYYAEAPLKETYNTCSLALSKKVSENNIKVILSGEGADEFFGGYVGYRFDNQRKKVFQEKEISDYLEDDIRNKLWGDPDFFYEKNYYEFQDITRALYSQSLNETYNDFNCLSRLEIDVNKLDNRHVFHKRSYIDLKLRLSDHLISDHCDRVTYAHSVEGRYPFLDINLVEFVKFIPPDIKLKGFVEKFILKELGKKYLPQAVTDRQKFGFVAPGSPHLLKNNIEWINDMLSYERIKKQGYFNPDTVEKLKKLYKKEDFKLNLPYDSDLLIIVLTFNIFLEIFNMPDL